MQLLLVILFGPLQILHAAGSVTEPGIRSHLNRLLLQLLGQLQDVVVIRHGLVKVAVIVIGAAQVAVGPGLLPLVAEGLGNPQVLLVALHSILKVPHGDVDRPHVALFPRFREILFALLGEKDTLLVAGQGVGVVPDGSVDVAKTAEGGGGSLRGRAKRGPRELQKVATALKAHPNALITEARAPEGHLLKEI